MKDKTLTKLSESMKHSKGFPALESTVSTVMSNIRDKSKHADAIVEPIVSDFAMTQRVLNLVNSAMYAPFAKDISSVSKALQIIGNDALGHIVLSVSLMPAKTDGADVDDFSELSKTILASELARSVCPQSSMEEMAIAALVYNIGTLVADKFLPVELCEVKKLIDAGVDADNAAVQVFGMTLTQLGVAVAKKWQFPPNLISIIDGTCAPTVLKIAQFSNTGAKLIHENKDAELAELVNNLAVPGLNKEKLEAKIQEKFSERANYVASVVPKQASSEHLLTELLCEVLECMPSKVEDLALKVFATVSEALKTAHCLLFMRVPTGEYRSICASGKGTDEISSRFKISTEFAPTAFHAVARRNVDIAITDVSRLKANALPKLYQTLLPDVKSFVILPITNGGVSGMLYLDWETHTELGNIELGLLRKIRDLFVSFFPHVEKQAET